MPIMPKKPKSKSPWRHFVIPQRTNEADLARKDAIADYRAKINKQILRGK